MPKQMTIAGNVYAIRFGIPEKWVRVDFVRDDNGLVKYTDDFNVFVTSDAFTGVMALPIYDVHTIDPRELEA